MDGWMACFCGLRGGGGERGGGVEEGGRRRGEEEGWLDEGDRKSIVHANNSNQQLTSRERKTRKVKN